MSISTDPTPKALILVKPSLQYEKSFIKATRERALKNPRLKTSLALKNLPKQIERWEKLASGDALPPKEIPRWEFWLIEGDSYIGSVQIRHRATGSVPQRASHLGHYLIPTKRTRAYLAALYQLAREAARRMGLLEIEIACFKHEGNCRPIMEELQASLIEEANDPVTHEIIVRYRLHT